MEQRLLHSFPFSPEKVKCVLFTYLASKTEEFLLYAFVLHRHPHHPPKFFVFTSAASQTSV